MNKSMINFIAEFTRGGEYNLNNLRFLKDPYYRKIVLSELSCQTKDAPILNRASYIDYGDIWNREVNEVFYMPIVSFTSTNLKNGFYSFLRDKVIGDYEDWKYNKKADKKLKNKYLNSTLWIQLKSGSQSLDVDDYSSFKGQMEWFVTGKFKIIKKEDIPMKFKDDFGNIVNSVVHKVTIKQVFAEPLEDIYNNKYSLEKEATQAEPENNKCDIDLFKDRFNKIKNKTIQSAELNRLNSKGVDITAEYFNKLISKRIYNSITLDSRLDITPQEFIDLCKDNDLKLTGGKKFGIEPAYPVLWESTSKNKMNLFESIYYSTC